MEDYIRGNKADFDVKIPSDGLWAKIEQELDQQKGKKSRKFPFWLSIAASLILVVGLVFLYQVNKKNNRTNFSAISPGYAKKEMRFASLIEEKRDSLLIYAKDNPDLYQKFNEDLKALSNDYEQLKKELQRSPDQRLIVRAMAQNLETQLQIVSQQLSVISQVDNHKREHQL